MRRLPATCVFLCALVPVPSAGAQQAAAPARPAAPTLPFRAGQWGLEFALNGMNAYSVGAVRFTSPTRAWVLDVRVNGEVNRQERWSTAVDSVDPALPPTFDYDIIQQEGGMSLLVGRRAYKGLSSRAARTLGIGATGGFSYREYLTGGRRVNTVKGWNGGLEGALGGIYLVTPSLGLSGTLRLGASYQRLESGDDEYGARDQRVVVGLGHSELRLSLFF